MGACTSKAKKNKEKHLKNDVTNGNSNNNNNKKDSIAEQIQRQSTSANVDKFDNVPYIDSEEKQTTTTATPLPPKTEQSIPINHDNDNDERTTVKTNFETNVSYSSAETIDKLKQEVYTYLREKIFPNQDEKQKLIDYVHKRILGSTTDTTIIDQSLDECFNDIEKQQHPDNNNDDKIKRRLMNIVTVYVASQSSDNSFLKALYDKMGPSLDLNTLNAETNEHEVVNVTVTKTIRQVFVDGSSTLIPNQNSNSTTEQSNNVIHISNNEHNIPVDLPDDIRRKAEQVLNKQGLYDLPEHQTNIEDRYYNNRSFQNEYPINLPDADTAATKIQAQFRGHKARRDFEKIKHKNKESIGSDHQESDGDDVHQNLSMNKEENEQERAAIAIQAQFRGYQVRKHLHEKSDSVNEQEQQEIDQIPSSSSNPFNKYQEYISTTNEIETEENNDLNRPRLERKSTQLSEDFEKHTPIPRDSNFNRELQEQLFYEENDDMNDPTLDKAATRIQASYRGYKTRKELGSIGSHSHSSHEQTHDDYDNIHNKNILSPSVHGNKVPSVDDDDNAAAVKIQAAYRGYRVRKDLEK